MAAKFEQNKTEHYSTFYSNDFYKSSRSDSSFISAAKVMHTAKKFFDFQSVIDIGCGVGNMLRACLDSGVKIIRGIDGPWVKREMLVIPDEKFSQFDISQPGLSEKISEKSFDLTISSEVAEHIELYDSEIYMNNLTSFSDVILFSAAIPFQGGTHHVNEQWPSYWIEKFRQRNFVPVDCIRPEIWNDKDISIWYRQNMLFFVKESALKNYPMLESEAKKPVLDLVHPELYENKLYYFTSFRPIFKELFPAFWRAVKRRLIK